MRQLKIELLLLKLHQLYFFSPTFLGWLYCTGGMMLCSMYYHHDAKYHGADQKYYSKIIKPENLCERFLLFKMSKSNLDVSTYLLEKEYEMSTF